eukprot:TRINITY_DN7078_c0_g1_i2.p1 TRINITY_DN7078_c0_g1~~TRINITY_DN7078_c0_g1_i2.p1  ORF type:complete len:328 (+),score=67.84 TRINITY_DN7078_c0_g1_i2:40-984(+)
MADSEYPPEFFDSEEYLALHGAPDLGVRWEMTVNSPADLQALVFKSDCASVILPDIDIEHPAGRARLLTLQSLLIELRDGVQKALSMSGQSHGQIARIISGLDECVNASAPFRLIIDDPLGISSIRDGTASRLEYKRTWEQDEELGVEHPMPDEQLTTVEALVDILANAQHVCGFTGAGISTESGIAAFRSADSDDETADNADTSDVTADSVPTADSITTATGGHDNSAATTADASAPSMKPIWKRFDPKKMSIQNLLSNKESRVQYWNMHRSLHKQIETAVPNASHAIFAWLAERGRLAAVITQNIDGMFFSH